MKVFRFGHRRGGAHARNQRGMTLVETMVTAGIFGFVVAAAVYCQIFGLRQDQLVNSQLGASDNSRNAFDNLMRDIRSAKDWEIGSATCSSGGSVSGYSAITNGSYWQGNALKLWLNATNSAYILYYFYTGGNQLRRIHTGDASSTLLAQNLTNTMYFIAEDYQGNTNTAASYKTVIHTVMQFCEYQYPLTRVGPGYFYNYYRLDLKATPHCPE